MGSIYYICFVFKFSIQVNYVFSQMVKDFAECATGRTVSVAWACKAKYKIVQDCMLQFTGPDAMETVRREYLRLRNEEVDAGWSGSS